MPAIADPPARQARKQRTRELLIAAGMRLFAQRGIAAVRMGDIARAARVAHGTVFLHFRTRDELLAVIIKQYAGAAALRIRELVEEKADLRHVLAAHLRGLAEMEPFYTRLIMEGPSLSPVARTALLGIQSAVATHLAAAVDRGVRDGSLRTLPREMLFNTWLGLVNHYVTNRDLFAPRKSVLTELGPKLMTYFLSLLKP